MINHGRSSVHVARGLLVAVAIFLGVVALVVGENSSARAAEPDKSPPTFVLTGTAIQAIEEAKTTGSYELRIAATDGSPTAPQSGVTKIEVAVDGFTQQSWEKSCPTGSCGLEATWTYSPGNYAAAPRGHVVTVKVTDGAGNVAEEKISREGIEKVPAEAAATGPDATPPDIGIFGSAVKAVEQNALSGNYELNIVATDGSPAAPQSGVSKIEIGVDGTTLQSYEKNCPIGSCRLEVAWPYSPGNFPGEEHFVTVTVRDRAGNVTTKTIELQTTPQPVAAWSFEEGSGSIAHDVTGNGHEGTLSAAGVQWAPGKFGTGLRFDGKSGCVTVPDSPALQFHEEFSVEAWVLPEGELLHLPAVTKQAEGFPAYGLGVGMTTSGRAEGQIGTATRSPSDAVSPSALPAGVWSHEALTFDGVSLRLYVNGTLVATKAVTLPAAGVAGPLEIGCSSSGHFRGKIDEVRLYGRGLTAAEIVQNMGAGYPTVTTEPVTEVGSNEAVLPGAANANGGETAYYFEYGPTANYGQFVEGDELTADPELLEVSEAAIELRPETTYHYRLAAKSIAGTAYGKDRTFTTGIRLLTAEEEEEDSTWEALLKPKPKAKAEPLGDFFGMMWTGNYDQMLKPTNRYATIEDSGAKMVRLFVYPEKEVKKVGEKEETVIVIASAVKQAFAQAAVHHLQVLPYIGAGAFPYAGSGTANSWTEVAKKAVQAYGPGSAYANPVTYWEIWNEPNMPFPAQTKKEEEETPDLSRVVNPTAFAPFFEEMTKAVRAGAKANQKESAVKILAPGLFGYRVGGCHPNCHELPATFLSKMDRALKQGAGAYDAVSIHPYVFKIGKKNHHHAPRPENKGDRIQVNKAIRQVLVKLKLLVHKPLWVSEIGFPVANDNAKTVGSFPPVKEQTQKELTDSVLSMLENVRSPKELDVRHAVYYNIQDASQVGNWDAHCGLLNFGGTKRPAWDAYKEHAK